MSGATLAIGRAVWQGTRNRSSRWFWWLMLPLLIAAPIGLWVAVGSGAALAATLALLSVGLLASYLALFYSLLQQNHPLPARLVPGHVRRLQLSAQLVWLLGALLGFGLSAWRLGSPVLAGLPAAALLLLMAWSARHPLLWALLWLPGPVLAWLMKLPAVAEAWHAQWSLVLDHAWLVSALALVAGSVAIGRLFGHGDEAHAMRYRKQQVWRASMRAQKPVTLHWQAGSAFDRLQRTMRRAYGLLLQRESERGIGQPVGMGRVMLVLGPQAHWATQLSQLALAIVIIIGLGVLLFVAGSAAGGTAALQAQDGLVYGALAYVAGIVQAMRVAMLNTRHEQALLSLVPGLPRGRDLNRALARRLMLQFLAQWAVAMGLTYLLTRGDARGEAWLLGLALAGPAMGLWLWADWSRARPLQAPQLMLLFMLPMGLMGLAALALADNWFSLAQLLTLALPLLLALAAWRWRVALRAPAAFPAGRNA